MCEINVGESCRNDEDKEKFYNGKDTIANDDHYSYSIDTFDRNHLLWWCNRAAEKKCL